MADKKILSEFVFHSFPPSGLKHRNTFIATHLKQNM